MSYPDRVRRPAVVTAAVVLLVGMAAVAVAYAVTSLVVLVGTVDAFRSAARDTSASAEEIDTMVFAVSVWTVLGALVSLVAGLLLAGLAVGVRAGRAGARVGTWVVAGLGVLAGCCGLVGLAVQRATPLQLNENERGVAELLARLDDAYPGWWIPLGAGLSVGQVLGYLVVAVLLALPATSAWFRRPAPAPYAPTYPPPYPPR
ncbi:hypothetical protein [Micromonospora thermarum]|uniref:Uncharacterized protein n=1 Tax=Micromonospora thermarum TaxID=2720024 RepID=A0ABX0YZ19_9ACTN|nr:hypothetical protein [Micromonospora thermarum]NJP30737.1 hypothetical protein [Micromonospora thermarum]